ncbi:hypothetical protein AVEN_30305-1, partial [Araneus ventricosus]
KKLTLPSQSIRGQLNDSRHDSDMETKDGVFVAINGLCPTPSADDTFSHHSGGNSTP